MGHECPYCSAELICEDTWGIGNFTTYEGEIYRCPNHEQFETPEDAFTYWDENVKNVHSDWEGFQDGWKEDLWDTFGCDSGCHHVSGSFYTDRSGDLKEGYPC